MKHVPKVERLEAATPQQSVSGRTTIGGHGQPPG